MKYFVFSVAFVLTAVLVQAQTNIPMMYNFKQKPADNSSQKLSLHPQTSREVPFKDNMPVVALKNEGVKIASNNLGEVYSMNIDNMPCLKPFKIKDEMPNAVEQKLPILPVQPKEQQ